VAVPGRCGCQLCHPDAESLAAFRADLEKRANNLEWADTKNEEDGPDEEWLKDVLAEDEDPEPLSNRMIDDHLPRPEVKMNMRRFKVGNPVLVHGSVVSGYWDHSPNGKTLLPIRSLSETPYNPPKQGVVIGLSRVQTGERIPGCNSRGFEDLYDDYEPPVLAVDKSYHVWLVRFSMTGKVVKVLNRDIEPGNSNFKLPLTTNSGTSQWDERAKAELREEMAKVPRDAKGRWLKKGA